MTQTPETPPTWNTTSQPGEPDFYPQPPVPQKTPWYRIRRNQVLAGLGGAVVVALAVVLPLTLSGGAATVPLTIHFALIDTANGGNCATGGKGGYSDISPGMPITVEDETHKVLASTTLPDTGQDDGGTAGCIWTLHVTVPIDRQQYGVTGGRRGTVTFSRQQLMQDKWDAELSLGGND